MDSSGVSTLIRRKESLASTELDLSRHLFLVVLGDCVVVLAAYVVAFQLRSLVPIPFTNELLPSERFLQVRHYWWLILALQPALLFLLDTYHEIRLKSLREFIQSIGAASGIQVLILICGLFLQREPDVPANHLSHLLDVELGGPCGLAAGGQTNGEPAETAGVDCRNGTTCRATDSRVRTDPRDRA